MVQLCTHPVTSTEPTVIVPVFSNINDTDRSWSRKCRNLLQAAGCSDTFYLLAHWSGIGDGTLIFAPGRAGAPVDDGFRLRLKGLYVNGLASTVLVTR